MGVLGGGASGGPGGVHGGVHGRVLRGSLGFLGRSSGGLEGSWRGLWGSMGILGVVLEESIGGSLGVLEGGLGVHGGLWGSWRVPWGGPGGLWGSWGGLWGVAVGLGGGVDGWWGPIKVGVGVL